MQFSLFLTHNILTSDDTSTDEENSTTDEENSTTDGPSTDEETSTTDEGDNTAKMYIHVFIKTRSEIFYIYVNFCRYVVWYTRNYTYSNH